MTITTSSIILAGGEDVEFQFEDGVGTGSSDTRVSFQIVGPSGAVVQPLETLDSGIPFQQVHLGIVTRIDSFAAAPLADGSFAFASFAHVSQPGVAAPDSESVHIDRIDASGHPTGFGGAAVGLNLPVTGISAPDPDFTAPPTITPLSGDHFAVFYTGVNGSTPFKGVAFMLDDQLNATNVVLEGTPDQVEKDGVADLRLAWANGDQVLVGGPSHTSLQGGAGADTIVSGGGIDTLFGGDGADMISGGLDFDRTNGNAGNDTVSGNYGNDWVTGGKGDDRLFGEKSAFDIRQLPSDDILNGNLGNDTEDGGPGNDTVRGGQGDDVLTGGDGNDFITGDLGNDTMTGGAGVDIFRVFNGGGQDRITDFNAALGDRVQLDPGTTFTLSQVGADTVIDLGGGHQTVLVGVTLSTLPATWIFGA